MIPRFGTSREVKSFEGTPCFILHLANTYEVGDEIIMDGAIQTNPCPTLSGLPKERYARMHALLSMDLQETRMHRWRFNMKTGKGKCAIFDARDIRTGPSCSILLPGHIPMDAHACWASPSALQARAGA